MAPHTARCLLRVRPAAASGLHGASPSTVLQPETQSEWPMASRECIPDGGTRSRPSPRVRRPLRMVGRPVRPQRSRASTRVRGSESATMVVVERDAQRRARDCGSHLREFHVQPLARCERRIRGSRRCAAERDGPRTVTARWRVLRRERRSEQPRTGRRLPHIDEDGALVRPADRRVDPQLEVAAKPITTDRRSIRHAGGRRERRRDAERMPQQS